jgi:hypothetical protein
MVAGFPPTDTGLLRYPVNSQRAVSFISTPKNMFHRVSNCHILRISDTTNGMANIYASFHA